MNNKGPSGQESIYRQKSQQHWPKSVKHNSHWATGMFLVCNFPPLLSLDRCHSVDEAMMSGEGDLPNLPDGNVPSSEVL